MDKIANMFNQLKNAESAGQKETRVSFSKFNGSVLGILKSRGYIETFSEIKSDKKYPAGFSVKLVKKQNSIKSLKNLHKVSTPGRRVYLRVGRISEHLRGKSDIFLSTSEGIMTGYDARKKGLGGELIGEVIR